MGEDRVFILHALFYTGMLIMGIPGSALTTRISTKRLVTAIVVMTSTISISLPFVITTSQPLLYVLRLLQGGLDILLQPCIVGVISTYTTGLDKGRAICFFYAGMFLAPAVSAVVSAALMCYVSWDSILFFYGTLSFLWSVLWIATVPASHPVQLSATRPGTRQKKCSVPWRQIGTSPTVWCFISGYFTHTFVYAALIFGLPQYFYDSFNVNIADIGILTTAPHVGITVSCVLGGVLADKLLEFRFSTTCVRRLLFGVGRLLEGLCLAGLYFTSEWRQAAALITVGATFGGLSESGYLPLPTDIAPQFAAVVTSFGCLGAVGAVTSSVLIATICAQSKDRPIEGWQTVFLIAGFVDITIVLVFVSFVKAEVQSWAVVTTETSTTAGETDPLLATSSTSSSQSGSAALNGTVDMPDQDDQAVLKQSAPYTNTDCRTDSTQHL